MDFDSVFLMCLKHILDSFFRLFLFFSGVSSFVVVRVDRVSFVLRGTNRHREGMPHSSAVPAPQPANSMAPSISADSSTTSVSSVLLSSKVPQSHQDPSSGVTPPAVFSPTAGAEDKTDKTSTKAPQSALAQHFPVESSNSDFAPETIRGPVGRVVEASAPVPVPVPAPAPVPVPVPAPVPAPAVAPAKSAPKLIKPSVFGDDDSSDAPPVLVEESKKGEDQKADNTVAAAAMKTVTAVSSVVANKLNEVATSAVNAVVSLAPAPTTEEPVEDDGGSDDEEGESAIMNHLFPRFDKHLADDPLPDRLAEENPPNRIEIVIARLLAAPWYHSANLIVEVLCAVLLLVALPLSQVDLNFNQCYTYWGFKSNCDSSLYDRPTSTITCTSVRTSLGVGAAFGMITEVCFLFLVAGSCFEVFWMDAANPPEGIRKSLVERVIAVLNGIVCFIHILAWAPTVNVFTSNMCSTITSSIPKAYGIGFGLFLFLWIVHLVMSVVYVLMPRLAWFGIV